MQNYRNREIYEAKNLRFVAMFSLFAVQKRLATNIAHRTANNVVDFGFAAAGPETGVAGNRGWAEEGKKKSMILKILYLTLCIR
jgi:hypothetical protein